MISNYFFNFHFNFYNYKILKTQNSNFQKKISKKFTSLKVVLWSRCFCVYLPHKCMVLICIYYLLFFVSYMVMFMNV